MRAPDFGNMTRWERWLHERCDSIIQWITRRVARREWLALPQCLFCQRRVPTPCGHDWRGEGVWDGLCRDVLE
jgi:hypothetical protein